MATRPCSSTTNKLYTAGYEGQSVDGFFSKLVSAGVKRLLDVRYNAISRKRGFSKSRLRELCQKHDIDYVHLRELGIPSSQRRSLRDSDDYRRLMRKYERSILPKVPAARQEASRLATERPSAFVCFEADAEYCHRGRLAQAISMDTGMKVVHLQ